MWYYVFSFSLIAGLVLPLSNSVAQGSSTINPGIGFVIANNPFQYEELARPKYFYSNMELNIPIQPDAVFPFFYKPDYALYHFICLEKTVSYYKVLYNDTGIAYIPNDTAFHFKSWESLLLNSFVMRLTKDSPVYAECTTSGNIISYNCAPERLKVIEVLEQNGIYWLNIAFSTECSDLMEQGVQLKYGWIIWRTETKLLIDLLLLC